MEKPRMKDYGLTVNDVKRYEEQLESYKQKCQIIDKKNIPIKEENDKLRSQANSDNDALMNKCLIWGFILFFVAVAIFSSAIGDNDPGLGIVVILAIDIFVFREIYQSNYSSPFLKQEYQYPDKDSVIEPALREKIEAYYKDCSEYELFLAKCRQKYWENLSGLQFEKEVAKVFRDLGYMATVTKASGDGGVDIILNKDGKRIAVQCKHHAKPVGPNDVRALMGVLYSQNFDAGIFVSLNGFTQSVYTEFLHSKSDKKLDLIGINKIKELVAKAERMKDRPSQNYQELQTSYSTQQNILNKAESSISRNVSCTTYANPVLQTRGLLTNAESYRQKPNAKNFYSIMKLKFYDKDYKDDEIQKICFVKENLKEDIQLIGEDCAIYKHIVNKNVGEKFSFINDYGEKVRGEIVSIK